jgi:hypothetical protein
MCQQMPHVRRWQYDDNSGERSIDLFPCAHFCGNNSFCFHGTNRGRIFSSSSEIGEFSFGLNMHELFLFLHIVFSFTDIARNIILASEIKKI